MLESIGATGPVTVSQQGRYPPTSKDAPRCPILDTEDITIKDKTRMATADKDDKLTQMKNKKGAQPEILRLLSVAFGRRSSLQRSRAGKIVHRTLQSLQGQHPKGQCTAMLFGRAVQQLHSL